MLLPLPDLVRTHTYLMLSWWVLCYIIAIVCHESSRSLTDTSRIRMIFADFASLDHYLAKMIKTRSAKAKSTATINPISVAIADPLLGSLALCILLDSTNYSYDPVSELSAAVSKLRFVVSNNRIIFGGLPLLNTALGRISQLPRSTRLALDLRAPFRSLILLIVPLCQTHFIYTRHDELLNWGTYASTTVHEHRTHGNRPITLETFSDLTEQLDTFDDAFTDHHNAYYVPDPTVSALAAAPNAQTFASESQIRAIVEAYHLSTTKHPTPAHTLPQLPKPAAAPSGTPS
jgi:hypothetical protein